MSAVVGIDLSSHALDLVKLQEDSAQAEWVRCELAGKTAWERTLRVRERLGDTTMLHPRMAWWDDVYLVAIEAPYGRGQTGTLAILNRVVGAVASSLPPALRTPERCWLIPPHEWKAGLGLKGKPTWADMARIADWDDVIAPAIEDARGNPSHESWQNARDAYCLAMFARDLNARAVEKALTA